LGLRKEGDTLRIEPRIPSAWPGFRAAIKHGGTTYQIVVESCDGPDQPELLLDGEPVGQAETSVRLCDDGELHEIRLIRRPSPR
jgi:cyclic beta-1,2-glucan synthetase